MINIHGFHSNYFTAVYTDAMADKTVLELYL